MAEKLEIWKVSVDLREWVKGSKLEYPQKPSNQSENVSQIIRSGKLTLILISSTADKFVLSESLPVTN